MSVDSVPSSKTNIIQNKLIYCRHFRTYSRCAMFDWSDTVFRRRNVTLRCISNTVLQPRYWGREADSPEVCRLRVVLNERNTTKRNEKWRNETKRNKVSQNETKYVKQSIKDPKNNQWRGKNQGNIEWLVRLFLDLHLNVFLLQNSKRSTKVGCTKLRNEIETQRTKRNETKRNITQRNILKCETKRNETKYAKMRNETKYTKMRNATKYT
jgi:hypothetical protein